MTRLEFLQQSLNLIAKAELTHEEAAILCTLSRFSNRLTSQLVRDLGASFKRHALASLGRKGLIIGCKKQAPHRFRYSLTESGLELMQSILGKKSQPA